MIIAHSGSALSLLILILPGGFIIPKVYGLIVTQYGDIEDTIKVMGISPDASIKCLHQATKLPTEELRGAESSLITSYTRKNNDHWPQWRCTHFARLSGRFYPSKRSNYCLYEMLFPRWMTKGIRQFWERLMSIPRSIGTGLELLPSWGSSFSSMSCSPSHSCTRKL
ncbi:hypothetical protein ACOSQ4_020624 [Xanthoceras sorbifolium]